jgi:hypothetical protein
MSAPRFELSPVCRSYLRAGMELADPALAAHVAGCPFCSEREAARRRLAESLRTRPVAPDELHSAAFRDGILERLVAGAEAGPLGEVLRRELVQSPAPPAGLEVELARSVREGLRRSASAPSSERWEEVKASVLADVSASRARATWRVRRMVVAAAAVAAVTVALVATNRRGSQLESEIVIVDMDSMPFVDVSPVAVLRRGVVR